MNMIGSLRGVVDTICSDHIILDVNGVGYIVYLSGKALGVCSIGDKIQLLIEVHSNGRENVTQLYGFIDKEEQQCLRLLVKVNGVSYKTAMSVLSKLTPKQFYLAVANEDKITLRVSGLGPKLINRVITELHSKVSKFEIGDSYTPVQEDAISALINLGYEKAQAYNAVRKIQDNSPRLKTTDIIRIALKDLHEINIV